MKAAVKNTQGRKSTVAGGRRSARLAVRAADLPPPCPSHRPARVGKARTKTPMSSLEGSRRCLDLPEPGHAVGTGGRPRAAPGLPAPLAQPRRRPAPPSLCPPLPPTDEDSSARANRPQGRGLADQPSRLVLARRRRIGAGFSLATTEAAFSVAPRLSRPDGDRELAVPG